MLESKRFRAAKRQSEFFKLIVEKTLAGVPVTEDFIGHEIFPGKYVKDETTIVRTTIKYLRRKLEAYYANEGTADAVLISLPEPPIDDKIKFREGEAYGAGFAVNPRHPADVEYRLGEVFRKRGEISDLIPALDHYAAALNLYRYHVGAMVGMVGVACDIHRYAHVLEARKPSMELMETVALKAVRIAPEFWRAHLIAGLFYVQMGQTTTAKLYFETCLRLNRSSTLEDPAYQTSWFAMAVQMRR